MRCPSTSRTCSYQRGVVQGTYIGVGTDSAITTLIDDDVDGADADVDAVDAGTSSSVDDSEDEGS